MFQGVGFLCGKTGGKAASLAYEHKPHEPITLKQNELIGADLGLDMVLDNGDNEVIAVKRLPKRWERGK